MSLVTLVDTKALMKITHTAADASLQALLDGCEEWLGRMILGGVSFGKQDLTDEIIDGNGGDMLFLAVKPVLSIIELIDRYDDSTVDTADYLLSPDGRGILREPDQTIGWQFGDARYKASYSGGYETKDDIPAGLRVLIMQFVARQYANLDGRTSEGSSLGSNVTWPTLVNSDVAKMLRGYNLGRVA